MASNLENATFESFLVEAKGKRIALFGAGRHVLPAERVLNAHGLSVSFLIDNDFWKWGREISGYECYPPNCLLDSRGEDAIVLITTDACFEVETQLQKLGRGIKYWAYPLFVEQIYSICGWVSLQIALKG